MSSATPSAATTTRPTLADRRARIAVAALFFTNGAIFANILPRYPGIKTEFALSNTLYGVAIAAFPAGALVAGLAAGAAIRRFRSSRVAVAGTLVTSAGVLLAGIAPTWWAFSIALFVAGAADAMTDVGQNAHGLRVQRRYGRSIINSFHAVWSIGAVTGGLMGAAAVAADFPRGVHLGISAVLFSAVALACYRFLLPGPERDVLPDGEVHVARSRWAGASPTTRTLVLVALVLVATCGTLVEDSGSSWAAVYLHGDLGAAAAVAAFGYVAMMSAQFVGRAVGDRLVDRYGQRAVARAGGALIFVGMGLALALPTIPGTIAGFAAAGLGTATLVPAAMHEADELPGLRPGTGLAVVSWLMRVGFLVSPPLVGLIADATSLRVGLLVVPLCGLLVVGLSQVLEGRRRAVA
ncbi:MFS transporter [Cellulomonas sp. PhB143]|uniref:MFS transporter n=1 Tax=Cellulomonas sp. PhB143 TaxID=2485186 RepID=UPI000F489033|nr:MFS transporter [Cellulomonas sp. PhB143]ROS75357.1 fucose permease [Cellulomonas sp. PhB143]